MSHEGLNGKSTKKKIEEEFGEEALANCGRTFSVYELWHHIATHCDT